MDEQNVANESVVIKPTPVKNKKGVLKKILFVIVALVLIAGPAAGVFVVKDKQVKNANKELQAAKTAQSATVASNSADNKSTDTTTQAVDTYSTDTTVGYSAGAKKRVRTSFVLPKGYGIVAQWPKTSTQADLNSYYITAFNDVIGYWQFNKKGTPEAPSTSNTRYFTITSFNSWRKVADPAGYTYDTEPGQAEQGPYTVAQKEAFIAALKKRTTDCITDATKGFKTNDGVYQVCYSLPGHPQAEGADWVMSVEGYAEVEGEAFYMRGYVDLPNSFNDPKPVESIYVEALKRITTVVDKNPAIK